jgi:TPR repeat protein
MAKDAPRNERRLRSLLRQPSARAANATMGILGIPMMLVWPLIGFVAYVLFDEDKLTFGGFGTLVVGALAMVTALYFLARVWLVNRQGLAIVTTHFGAAPPAAPGQPSTCRVCNAVLPSAAGSLFAQCAYCGADNVLGLDVRGDAKLERAQSASLTTALARRTADRVTFGVLAIAAAAVMVGDVKLLKPHLVPVGTWMRCNGDHPACGTPLEAFEKRCATGDAAACAKVLDLAPKVYTLYDFGPNDSTLALQAGCTKGAAIACRGAGDHDWEDKTSHDAPRAKAALSRGCELGDGSACTELGEIDERRRDTTYEQIESGDYSTLPARSAAAYALFDKGCKAGDPAACLDAGTYLRGGVAGVPADLSRAKALAAAACKATGPKSPACSRVACDGGDMKACLELATAYAQGSGVQADDELVMSLDEQACEGSNGEACALSGYQRAHSKAYKPDLPRAHELYKKGCELGSGLGCHNLGHAYFVGDGVDKDLTEALTWFTRACKLGYENGCGAVDEVKAALAKQGSGIGDQGSGLNPGP